MDQHLSHRGDDDRNNICPTTLFSFPVDFGISDAESDFVRRNGENKPKRKRTFFKNDQLQPMKAYFANAINYNLDANDLKQL